MFLELLKRLGRQRVIYDRINNEPYLERYYLFLKERNRFPFNIFLHKFLKGDTDDIHDHPWPYVTIILRGGYYEWMPEGDGIYGNYIQRKVWRGPGYVRFSKADSFHRIELKPGVTAWTLFIPGPKQREWGFFYRGNWIPHEQYFNIKKEAAK